MIDISEKRARARRRSAWLLRGRRLLALCMALCICGGLLLIPAGAEEIHPPEQSTESPALPAPETSAPQVVTAPPEDPAPQPDPTDPVLQPEPGQEETVPGNTGATSYPVHRDDEPATDVEPTESLVEKEVNVTAHGEAAVSAGTKVNNTYILEVSTGTVKEDGAADNVSYFVIYYTSGGAQRSTVIFPGADGVQRGMDAAAAVASRNERRQLVEDIFGYSTAPLRDQKGLRSVKTDQFLFTTPTPITTIDRIQIFGRVENTMREDGTSFVTATDWACQGMRVYEVNTLYGQEMYGWYSDEGYIDFSGYIIADVDMSYGGGIFRWNNSGGVFNIVGPGVNNGVAGCVLVNTETAGSYPRDHHVGEDHISQVTNRVVFRLELADQGDGGFECLAGSYGLGSHTKISDLGLCETAALSIRYEDKFGCLRDLTLPLIVNALGWTMEQMGDVAVAGFAQQGNSICVSAMLPDFSSLSSARIVLGEQVAAAKAKLITTEAASNNELRASRAARSAEDGISYLTFAAYPTVAVNIRLEGATLRYYYTPGARNPARYFTAGSISGNRIESQSEYVFSLSDYHDNLTILPIDRQERYLLTICTDNVANSGTTADVYLQFKYLNMKDKEVTSSEFRLRDYVTQFYGEWPGNTAQFAYNYGLRGGGTVQCMIPLSGVKQFRTVSIRLDGADEWQMKGLQIQMVRSYDARVLRWQEIDSEGLLSHVRITRAVNAQSICFKMGQIYSDGDPMLDPDDEHWQPGTLIQDDHMVHEFDGHSTEVDAREEVDWSTLRLFMSYEDACQELGFNRQRCLYEVQVNVAGNKVNDDDDDCGSENLFYFQLAFEYGNSGCVLANAQLPADAFRTGAASIFYIPTAMDYGELQEIRIIPDDQDTNGDIYDKLKIDSIQVRKKTDGKISPNWTADSESVDGLGWVGIKYRDAGAMGSNRGAEGRSLLELAHFYQITKSSYSTKLLVSITTGAYETNAKPNKDGEMVTIADPNLIGGLSMSYNYLNHEGKLVAVDPFDVVDLMNDYNGLPDSHTRTLDDKSEEVNYCVSNPDYQFRPGTTDNFFIDVDNIAQLMDAKLQIRSSVVTKWNITNVAVYQVQGPGTRYINKNGEYDYKYPAGKELLFKAEWNREENLVKDVQIYRTEQKNSIGEINIVFNENEFERYDDDQWSSTVTREPASKDDMLNIFIYPSTESAATNPDNYNLFGTVLYTDTMYHNAQQQDTGNMSLMRDEQGRPVFYALGVNTSYLESITGLNVFTDSAYPVHAPLSFGLIQRIRSGVLIDTYYLTSFGNADQGLTMNITTKPDGQNLQRVFLQFSEDMVEQQLIPDEKDLAVAVYFTTDTAYDTELRSKYVTLTDQGISSIKPGQVVELDFGILNLKEITGLNLVNMGRIEETISNAEVIEQLPNGAVSGKWSFRGTMTPARMPTRFNPAGTVTLLDLDVVTAANTGSFNSGTTGPVKMTVGYLDEAGGEQTRVYEDIRPFVTSGAAFTAGSTVHLRVLVPDVEELRWIELEPVNGSDGVTATWKVDSVSSMTDLSGVTLTRVVNQTVQAGAPLRVSLAEILLSGLISVITGPDQTGIPSGDYVIPTGGSQDIALNAGEGVYIVPRIEGSKTGLDVKINRVDSSGGVGQAMLADTRGYTTALLEQYAQSAEEKGNTHEAAMWRSIVPDNGTWQVQESYDERNAAYTTEYIRFLPPRNYTASVINYRITVTSRENNAATVMVNLSVPPETDPVPQMLAAAQAQDGSQGGVHVHDMVYTSAVAPTCTKPGHTEYYSCSRCGKYFSDALGEKQIENINELQTPALGHIYTLTPVGSSKHAQVCQRCFAKDEAVPCTFKDWTYDDVTGKHIGTCECGNEFTENCSYRYTADNDQTHTGECIKCGHKTTAENHTKDNEVTVPPTATEQGYVQYTCKTCDYTWIDHYIPATGETTPPETGNP